MTIKKTRVLIVLLAGLIASIICIINNYELLFTLKARLITLIAFYLLGTIVIFALNRITNVEYLAASNENDNLDDTNKE